MRPPWGFVVICFELEANSSNEEILHLEPVTRAGLPFPHLFSPEGVQKSAGSVRMSVWDLPWA